MSHYDILIKNGNLFDVGNELDVAISGGKIVSIGKDLSATADTVIDATGKLVAPSFVDSHTHLDKALSAVDLDAPGLAAAVEQAAQFQASVSKEEACENIKARTRVILDWEAANGSCAVKSHVRLDEAWGAEGLRAMVELKEEYRGIIDVINITPYDPSCDKEWREAAEKGLIDFIAGYPGLYGSDAYAEEADPMFELAAQYNLPLDLHINEFDGPDARCFEYVLNKSMEMGLGERLTCGHVTSLAAVSDEEAARLIARHAQGGMRDAISLLELCAGNHLPITAELVSDTIGSAGREGMLRVANAVVERDYEALFELVDETVRSSRDLAVFWQDLIILYRDMLVLKTTKNAVKYLDLTDSEQAAMTKVAARFTRETLLWQLGLLEDALFSMQRSHSVKRTVCEITLVRLCDPLLDTSAESILSRLSKLEEAALTGAPMMRVSSATAPQIPVAEPDEFPPEPFFENNSVYEPQGAVTDAPASAVPEPLVKNVPSSSAKTPVPPAEDVSNRRVLRPLRAWSEVIARVAEGHPMVGPFFKQAKAYVTENGQVVIKFSNEFAKSMTQRDNTPDALRAALSMVLERPVPPDGVITEVETNEQTAMSSMLDLILEAAEE